MNIDTLYVPYLSGKHRCPGNCSRPRRTWLYHWTSVETWGRGWAETPLGWGLPRERWHWLVGRRNSHSPCPGSRLGSDASWEATTQRKYYLNNMARILNLIIIPYNLFNWFNEIPLQINGTWGNFHIHIYGTILKYTILLSTFNVSFYTISDYFLVSDLPAWTEFFWRRWSSFYNQSEIILDSQVQTKNTYHLNPEPSFNILDIYWIQ